MEDADEAPEALKLEAQADGAIKPVGPRRPVPVTLITGFLGSGKTTLVRHILSAPHGLRIAVILNEFGEGVEGAYFQDIQGLKDSSGEWVELDNGCMCCSVKSEFVQALETLLARERKPDYILIETTGLANPGPVAAALWTDEELEAGVQLDSIITVVDAINIDRQLHAMRSESSVNEAQVQVAYADLILLNKMDLCQEEAVARAEADIRAINSSVHIMRTSNCNVDLHLLLNRQGYKHGAEVALEPIAEDDGDEVGDDDDNGDEEDGEGDELIDLEVVGTRVLPTVGASLSQAATTTGGLSSSDVLSTQVSMSRLNLARSSAGGVSSHSRAVSINCDQLGGAGSDDEFGGASSHSHHDPQIQTVTLTSDKPLDLDKVKAFMDKLLWDRETHPEDIYRVKAVLNISGQHNKHMLQAVYELYNIAPSAPWLPGEKRQSRLVLIGRLLNKAKLEQWFAAL